MTNRREKNIHPTREAYLNAGIAEIREPLREAGYELPDKIRASMGFTSGGKTSPRRAEAWHADASEGGWYEIFIRPDIHEEAEVLTLLLIALITTLVPAGTGRGPKFKAIATSAGLTGSMRDPKTTPGLQKRLNSIANNLGPLEHNALDIGWRAVEPKPKQGTRMLKFQCPSCRFPLRFTEVWVGRSGAPICATCKVPFVAAEASEPGLGPDMLKGDDEHNMEDGKAGLGLEKLTENIRISQSEHANIGATLRVPAPMSIPGQNINWTAQYQNKPEQQVRDTLKSAGGRYDNTNRCWRGSSADVVSLQIVVEKSDGTFLIDVETQETSG